MFRREALTLERRPSHFSKKVEYVYYKGMVVLEVGGTSLEFKVTVNQRFGTDSIIEGQEEERYSDKKRALEIYSASEPDFNRMCFDLDNARAFQLLSNDGPITGFSERIESKPLTAEQLFMVEQEMMEDKALEDLYGFKGKLRAFNRRRKGFTHKGVLRMKYAYDCWKSYMQRNYPNGNWKTYFEAAGTYSLGSEQENRKVVAPIYEVELDYRDLRLSFSRHWLTACAKNSAAIAFINHWESVSPEDRLADFLQQICALSGMKPRFPASDKV